MVLFSPDFSEELTVSPDFSEELTVSLDFSEELTVSPDFSEELTVSPDLSEGLTVSPDFQCGSYWQQSTPLATIYSPGYPSNYPNNLECRYILRAEDKTMGIGISFIDFHLEQYDFIKVSRYIMILKKTFY